MVATKYEHITKRIGVRGGCPYVRELGISVSTIVVMLNAGDSLESIIQAYPGLNESHIEEVKAYYSENKRKIDREINIRSKPPAGYSVGRSGILSKK